MAPANVLNGYARATMTVNDVVTNAWAPIADAKPDENKAGKQEAAVHWLQLAWEKPIALNVVHVTFQKVNRAPRWFAIEIAENENAEAGGRTTWRQIAEVDHNRHRRLVLGLDRVTTRRLRIVLREPAALCEIRVYDEPSEVVKSARRAFKTMRLPDEGPFFPWDE